MSFGTLNPPLGLARLNTIKLISKLILTNNTSIIEEIIKLGTLNKILNLAFEFKWNNFLHAQMMNILTHILTAKTLDDSVNECDTLHLKLIDHVCYIFNYFNLKNPHN
jgi:UDP-N-acetylglucosamine 2-epimerase